MDNLQPKRRDFLKGMSLLALSSGAGCASEKAGASLSAPPAPVQPGTSAQANPGAAMRRRKERFQERNYDLVVVGGGMAGICAAMEAARNGMNTALINSRPVLGGCASSEIRVHISGADQSLKQPDYAESGIVYELMLENKARNPQFSYSVWDMILFEAVKNQKNLTCYFNTVMYDCEMDGEKIAAVLCMQETTEMRYRLGAPLFVDATGNGTLGFFAGADFRTGSESKDQTGEPDAPETPNNERMGLTLMFKARDMGRPVKFTPPSFARKYTEHDLRYRMHRRNQKVDFSSAVDPKENERTGGVSSRGSDYGYFWIELMGHGDDIILETEEIRDNLYAVLYGVWDHIKNGCDAGAENLALEWVGAFPGARESRRFMGDYVLNENDVYNHARFKDAVAYGGWCLDIHCPHGADQLDVLPSGDCHYVEGVYTIPYRCYYSRNVPNLFLAGRDISATRWAFSSARIIGTCAVGGQAVGAAAALCGKYHVMPRELAPHIPEVQQLLLKHDAFIPGIVNHDEADLARTARFAASSFVPGGEPGKVADGISRKLGDDPHAWVSGDMSPSGETLSMSFARPERISEIRLTFESNFAFPIRQTMSPNRQAQQREGVPMELVRDFDLRFMLGGREVGVKQVRGNHQRLCVVGVDAVRCDSVDIHVLATNGFDRAVVHEVRAYGPNEKKAV